MYEKVFNVDVKLCELFNRASHYNIIKILFSIISRLGDGIFWYSLMIFLTFHYGQSAIPIVLQMALSGVFGLIIYKLIKSNTARLRPYIACTQIKLGAQPLDQYSFPSGHTLHAVGFTNIICFYYTDFFYILLPITALIAASRMILGLHYPSDVVMGAIIGFITSSSILYFYA